MKVTIKTTNVALTVAIDRYIRASIEKLDKIVHTMGASCEAWVEIGKTTLHHRKGPVWRAELVVRIPRKVVRSEATGKDLYAAINEAKKELYRELVKFRGVKQLSYPKSSRRALARRARGKE